MPECRAFLHVLRWTAMRLMLACVFAGPIGLGVPLTQALSARLCGVACPCDEFDQDEHLERGAQPQHTAAGDSCCPDPDAPAEDANPAPLEDECPDGCPDCGCRVGAALAVLLPHVPALTVLSVAPAAPSAAAKRPARGARLGVFRPPRARA